ncbi:MAG: dihydropyrimidinase [Chloroflexi bacterium]|nr:dihydropyrimidinase [Chloroflexota bacterium]MCI0644248.1 dihydropyrimidinase [Chloroflexota bacterium]MCI0727567.1 dihydropyrimidinase [Chloroflexota bacterium]
MGILIKNGTIVTAGDTYAADVLVEGEVISLIGRRLAEAGQTVVDAAGKLVMPGGIDVHTHLELPVSNTVSSDDFFTGQRAAAFGGTTSHIDFAIQPKGGSLSDGLAHWHEKAAGKACIDYGFHANVTDAHEGIYAELPELPEQGVTSVKLLMAYKGTFQVDDTTLFRVMQAAARHGLLVMVHAENGDVIAELTAGLLAEGKVAPHYHLAAHPEAAEAEATCRAVSMAGISGALLYVVHMTCAGAVEQLAIGRAKGYPVMGESCSQYLIVFEDRLQGADEDPFAGAKYVCSPPLRTEMDAEVLWEALADQTLQAVSTDHCPFYYEGGRDGRPPGKELGRENFTRIPNGLPGIEDRLVVTWHLGVNGGRISPNRFVALTSANPARIFGLYPRKGTIAVGSDADLLIWDPAARRTISAGRQHMACDYNIYEGLEVQGWPEKLFLRGRLIVDGDRWLGEQGGGRFLHRQRSEWL